MYEFQLSQRSKVSSYKNFFLKKSYTQCQQFLFQDYNNINFKSKTDIDVICRFLLLSSVAALKIKKVKISKRVLQHNQTTFLQFFIIKKNYFFPSKIELTESPYILTNKEIVYAHKVIRDKKTNKKRGINKQRISEIILYFRCFDQRPPLFGCFLEKTQSKNSSKQVKKGLSMSDIRSALRTRRPISYDERAQDREFERRLRLQKEREVCYKSQFNLEPNDFFFYPLKKHKAKRKKALKEIEEMRQKKQYTINIGIVQSSTKWTPDEEDSNHTKQQTEVCWERKKKKKKRENSTNQSKIIMIKKIKIKKSAESNNDGSIDISTDNDMNHDENEKNGNEESEKENGHQRKRPRRHQEQKKGEEGKNLEQKQEQEQEQEQEKKQEQEQKQEQGQEQEQEQEQKQEQEQEKNQEQQEKVQTQEEEEGEEENSSYGVNKIRQSKRLKNKNQKRYFEAKKNQLMAIKKDNDNLPIALRRNKRTTKKPQNNTLQYKSIPYQNNVSADEDDNGNTSSSTDECFELRQARRIARDRIQIKPINMHELGLYNEDMAPSFVTFSFFFLSTNVFHLFVLSSLQQTIAIFEALLYKTTSADITPMDIDLNVDWTMVGGLEHHIEKLKEMVVLPLLYPKEFAQFRMSPPKGVLFYGPPGTGKTLVARVLAAQV
ncbi:hypothetical protein RFI_11833 [Reticulomyxa filosa]|uniref:ATPase AAA-type core domain-containing protein n=1 Tax=Reticulomyxa filosa TaxID=46433 RepID=X6NHC3_RETFI|nr:hypothetical protein RFI_11833 [Reticulomyxa filosa]|eukprot:ETO25298.1 hypothetical protein RFI_11833 [Reticulomyxa filosa]